MKTSRTILILAVIAIVVIAMLVPALRPAKIHGGSSCLNNLRFIQLAKEMYAENVYLTGDVSFKKEQLLSYGLGGKWPQCPKGGEYSIGSLHQSLSCSYPDHADLSVSTK